MKTIILTCFAVALLSIVYGQDGDKYPTKYDNVDLDDFLKNKRLLNSYVDCVLDNGTCTQEGTLIKGKKSINNFYALSHLFVHHSMEHVSYNLFDLEENTVCTHQAQTSLFYYGSYEMSCILYLKGVSVNTR